MACGSFNGRKVGLTRQIGLAGLLAALVTSGLCAAVPADSPDNREVPWYRRVTQWIKPSWPRWPSAWFGGPGEAREAGPTSVFTARGGRRGLIYRESRPADGLEGLPQLSPDVMAPGYRWTLDTAISRALQANPSIVEAKLALLRQEGVEMDTRSKALPQVTALGSMDTRQNRLFDRDPSIPPTVKQSEIAERSHDLRLEIRQLLFAGGAVRSSIEQQRLTTLQSRLALQVAAYRTVSLVKQGYDAVLQRAAAVANMERRSESLRQIAEFTDRQVKLGSQPELEGLRAEAEYKLAEADVWRARASLLQARIYLARQLYLPVTEGKEPELQFAGELMPAEFPLPQPEAVALALERRLDLYAGKLQVEAAGKSLQTVRAARLPTVEGFASYARRSSYYQENSDLEGWSGGVTGRWMLFDGFGLKGRSQAARADLLTSKARLDDLNVQMRTGLSELYGELDLGRVSLSAQAEAVALAEKSVTYARRAYELGQATLEQVLESQNALLRSQNAYGEAVLALNTTIAQLEFSVGGVLPGRRDVGLEVMP